MYRLFVTQFKLIPQFLLTTTLILLIGCGGETQQSQIPTPTATQSLSISTPTQVPPTPTPTTEPIPRPTNVVAVDSLEIPLLQISDATNEVPDYDRGDWRHWIDVDGDCQNARHEVLVEESLIPVTFTDARECSVAEGQWIGLYTGVTVTTASKLDVDHMVPLANAHQSGGWAWDSEKKKEYANNLSYPGHLIAVTASANRSKGAKSPENWRPDDKSYWCQYAIDWITIKSTWELTATNTEWETLLEMLDTCSEDVSMSDDSGKPTSTHASPTPTMTQSVPKATENIAETTCVDLNTASAEALEEIVHIGTSRAEGIIAIRPINSIADLDQISGIGPGRLSDIIDQNLACIR